MKIIWPTHGWETSTPEAEGMDSAALASLIDLGAAADLDSLLVTRHGKIVLETYYAPFRSGIRHALNSATKGVVGTLLAMAIQQGLVKGVDEPLLDFFSDRRIAKAAAKKAITLQHVLDMTSGLQWHEPLMGGPMKSVAEMRASSDWVQCVLDQPLAGKIGRTFNYNSGSTHLLSALLTKVTGRSALEYAREQLFGPLGISNVRWSSDPQGITTGGTGLFLTPPDAAKLGYLYLRNGTWEGRQFLPAGWIEHITESITIMLPGRPLCYGNLFWTVPLASAYMAVGFNSQVILVLPDSDIVAVVTGKGPPQFPQLLQGLAVAVKAEGALPPDPQGNAALARRVAAAGEEKPSTVGKTGAMAPAISGRRYRLEDNALKLKAFTLNLTGDPTTDLTFGSAKPGGADFSVLDPLGLAGRYREGYLAGERVFGSKGNWLADDTFALARLDLGAGLSKAANFIFKFTGDQVAIQFESAIGQKVEMRGRAEG
jgi:CubicO group peptidase (beta-lactamase class C family)